MHASPPATFFGRVTAAISTNVRAGVVPQLVRGFVQSLLVLANARAASQPAMHATAGADK